EDVRAKVHSAVLPEGVPSDSPSRLYYVPAAHRPAPDPVRRSRHDLTAAAHAGREEAHMLSREDNELLCRVGRGTPMGDLIRQYWIPAVISTELPEADGPPMRVRLLGENLIAFRVTSGRVGLVQNHCTPRACSAPTSSGESGGRFAGGMRTGRARAPTCRASRQRAPSRRGCGRARTRASSPTASCGRTWARGRRRRPCRTSSRTSCRRTRW